MTTQTDPGWGLDRLDEQAAELDDEYTYTATGAGATVYVLDTGIDLDDPEVAAEFGGRATMVWDANGGDGEDCQGHGTKVSSIIAGSTYGVAKGATLQIAKVSIGCTRDVNFNWATLAIDWLADNAPTGSIINFSSAISFGPGNCNNAAFHLAIENAALFPLAWSIKII